MRAPRTTVNCLTSIQSCPLATIITSVLGSPSALAASSSAAPGQCSRHMTGWAAAMRPAWQRCAQQRCGSAGTLCMGRTYLPQHIQPLHHLQDTALAAMIGPAQRQPSEWNAWSTAQHEQLLASRCPTHLADHHMLAIALWRRRKCDVELAGVAVLSCAHGAGGQPLRVARESLASQGMKSWLSSGSMCRHGPTHPSWQTPRCRPRHACSQGRPQNRNAGPRWVGAGATGASAHQPKQGRCRQCRGAQAQAPT